MFFLFVFCFVFVLFVCLFLWFNKSVHVRNRLVRLCPKHMGRSPAPGVLPLPMPLFTINSTRSPLLSVHGYYCRTSSKLLQELLTVQGGTEVNGRFPDIKKQLIFYNQSFDQCQAKEKGVIIPWPGVNELYDAAMENIEAVEEELQSYLKEQKRKLKCSVRKGHGYY